MDALRIPQLVTANNKRKRLPKISLYPALYFGDIDIAIKLLHIGSDPSFGDGYGENAIDWTVRHEALMHRIYESHSGCCGLSERTGSKSVYLMK